MPLSLCVRDVRRSISHHRHHRTVRAPSAAISAQLPVGHSRRVGGAPLVDTRRCSTARRHMHGCASKVSAASEPVGGVTRRTWHDTNALTEFVPVCMPATCTPVVDTGLRPDVDGAALESCLGPRARTIREPASCRSEWRTNLHASGLQRTALATPFSHLK